MQKLKSNYKAKINKMSSDELLKQLDMMIMAECLMPKQAERTLLVKKAIVTKMFEKYPETAKAEGFRKKFIEN